MAFQKPKNPAMAYISSANQEDQQATIEPVIKETKENVSLEDSKAIKKDNKEQEPQIVYVEKTTETKSRRKNLLLYPSVHDRIEELAKKESIRIGSDVSFNDLANRILKEYADRH